MNKKIKYLSFALFSLFVVSCDNKDDATDYSSITVNEPIGTVTAVTPGLVFGTAINVNEGNVVEYIYKVTIDKAQPIDLHLLPSQISGDAVLDKDYELTEVVIPAYSTSGNGKIKIIKDALIENSKSLTLQIGTSHDANVKVTSKTVIFNIQNFVSNVLELTFNFDRNIGTTTSTLCGVTSDLSGDKYDIDFILYDGSFSDTGNIQAQTGKCIEAMSLDLANYPDDTYHVTAFLYANADLDLAEIGFPVIGVPEFNIPITVDYLRAGAINKATFTQEAANQFTSNTAVGDEQQVVDIQISTVGGVRKFTIKDTAGNSIATGKMASKPKFSSKRLK